MPSRAYGGHLALLHAGTFGATLGHLCFGKAYLGEKESVRVPGRAGHRGNE
jgi:hypothetical protein